MTLKQIAHDISMHLKRFEFDPRFNSARKGDARPYYCAGAYDSGRYVGICYVSFQGTQFLSKAEAARYLAWLDAGNVGTHYTAGIR